MSRLSREELGQAVLTFATEGGYQKAKGGIAVGLQVTRYLRENEATFPVNPDDLLTGKGGQVKMLAGPNIKRILEDHGITRRFLAEGGRTNRGSIDYMRGYVAFLNELAADGRLVSPDDLDVVEEVWVEFVREYFLAKPFQVNLDHSMGLSAFVREVLELAAQRDQDGSGLRYAGAVLQHLIGAKLSLVFPDGVDHHSFSTSDEQGGRHGDFELGDVAVHVTTAPSQALMERCAANLRANLRPIIVTVPSRVDMARILAEDAGLWDRIDILDASQFITTNIYELSNFAQEGRDEAVRDLLDAYNSIIDEVEENPSLRIEAR